MFSSRSLYFYPFFSGAPFPYWEPSAKAGFLGLDLSYSQTDMLLAVMEGVAFQIPTVVHEYKKCGQQVKMMRILGGAVRSSRWIEILRSLFYFRMEVMEELIHAVSVRQ